MKEFRERVLIPLLVPLGALAIIVVVVLNVSRVLLALEERSGPDTVVAVAIIVAAAFCSSSWIASAPKNPARTTMIPAADMRLTLAGERSSSLREEK